MHRMKHIFLISFTCLLFSSCLDSMQSVSYKNGEYSINSRFTISKSALKLIMSFADSADYSDNDYSYDDDYLNYLGDAILGYRGRDVSSEIDSVFDDLKKSNMFPKGGKEFKIDSNYDFGIGYNASIKSSAYNIDNYREYIPISKSYFSYIEVSSFLKDDYAEIGELLMGMKHKIFISKSVINHISHAKITDTRQRGNELNVIDMGETYCIEVPYEALLNRNKETYEYICFYY